MKIRKKEGVDLNISITTDKKNYLKLVEDIKKLGKKYENSSDSDKLDYSLVASFQRQPYMKIKGWASRVVDDNGRTTHVLFLDYDNILYRCLVDEIRYLIEKYNLPPCYIMKTFEKIDPNGEAYGNYLVYNLKKCYFKDIIEMQDKLSCDQAFKKIPILYRFKCWCARISKKNSKKSAPIFKEVIGNLNKEYNQEISNAHLEALNGIYPETKNLIKYKNKDKGDISKVAFVEYVTASS